MYPPGEMSWARSRDRSLSARARVLQIEHTQSWTGAPAPSATMHQIVMAFPVGVRDADHLRTFAWVGGRRSAARRPGSDWAETGRFRTHPRRHAPRSRGRHQRRAGRGAHGSRSPRIPPTSSHASRDADHLRRGPAPPGGADLRHLRPEHLHVFPDQMVSLERGERDFKYGEECAENFRPSGQGQYSSSEPCPMRCAQVVWLLTTAAPVPRIAAALHTDSDGMAGVLAVLTEGTRLYQRVRRSHFQRHSSRPLCVRTLSKHARNCYEFAGFQRFWVEPVDRKNR
jgi:hypothetical protein